MLKSWSINEYFVPLPSLGELLALMGGSGSGKSTTLDALAFRTKQSNTKGDIFLNERKCDAVTARNFIGFDLNRFRR